MALKLHSFSYLVLSFLVIANITAQKQMAEKKNKKPVATKAHHPGVTEVTTLQEFREVLSKSGPAIIKFSAEWCPACKMMEPGFEAVAEKYKDAAAFATVDVDTKDAELRAAIEPFIAKGIPATIFKRTGGVPEEIFERHVTGFLGRAGGPKKAPAAPRVEGEKKQAVKKEEPRRKRRCPAREE